MPGGTEAGTRGKMHHASWSKRRHKFCLLVCFWCTQKDVVMFFFFFLFSYVHGLDIYIYMFIYIWIYLYNIYNIWYTYLILTCFVNVWLCYDCLCGVCCLCCLCCFFDSKKTRRTVLVSTREMEGKTDWKRSTHQFATVVWVVLLSDFFSFHPYLLIILWMWSLKPLYMIICYIYIHIGMRNPSQVVTSRHPGWGLHPTVLHLWSWGQVLLESTSNEWSGGLDCWRTGVFRFQMANVWVICSCNSIINSALWHCEDG